MARIITLIILLLINCTTNLSGSLSSLSLSKSLAAERTITLKPPSFTSGLKKPKVAFIDSSFEPKLRRLISLSHGAVKPVKIPLGIHKITKNLTIPRNVSLIFEPGAILHLGNGSTLVINGAIEAGNYQIFSWDGTGKVVLGKGAAKEILLKWWGAVGDGRTDDTKAVQAAIDLLNGGLSATLVGSSGDNYLVDTLTFKTGPANIGPNQRFCGNGATLTQAGMGNILNIKNRSGRLMIDRWNIIGSCSDLWVHDGLNHKPKNVTFDGRPGIQVNNLAAVSRSNRWFYKNGRLIIRCPVRGQTASPNDTYHNPGISIDGNITTTWTRFFSGTAIYLGAKYGPANINISNLLIRNFDKAIHMHYALYNSVRDCRLLACNTAIYGDENYGHDNINLFENLRIAGIYGDSAIYWRNSYGIEFRHCVIEVVPNRLIHMIHCGAVNIDNMGMEVTGFGCKTPEVFLFDNVSGLSVVNSSLWAGGGGSHHAYTSFFKFINRCNGIRVASNLVVLTDSPKPPTKIALFSTDGTATGLSFRNNSLRSRRWTIDANPTAASDNNAFLFNSWIILPVNMVRRAIFNGEHATTLNFENKLSPPSHFHNQNAASVIDHAVGFLGHPAWKITWQGQTPQARLNNVFTYPPSGNFVGVITLFYKSDVAQHLTIILPNGGSWEHIPVAGDGKWRCLSMITAPIKFPRRYSPHGLWISSDGASGHLWLSLVSLRWFSTQAEADAWMGAEDFRTLSR